MQVNQMMQAVRPTTLLSELAWSVAGAASRHIKKVKRRKMQISAFDWSRGCQHLEARAEHARSLEEVRVGGRRTLKLEFTASNWTSGVVELEPRAV